MAERTQAGSGAPAPRSPTDAAEGAAVADGTGFDDVIARLRGVVERLEAGSLGLEQALAAFEEGVRLSRRGAEILDRAERRVEQLTRGEGGGVVAVPLPTPATGDGDAPP